MTARRAVALLIALVTLAVGGATEGARAAAQTYNLGVLLGLTGTGAPYSADALKGIEIAVDEINVAGGLLGKHPIILAVGNTRTRVEVAKVMAERLIRDDRVRAVIGTYSSATALAVKPICREYRVLHIAPISNSEDITKLDPSPYTYSVVPNTYMMAKAVALGSANLAAKAGWSRYVTIASDYAWGRSSQQIQTALLKKLSPGLELVAEYWPPLGHVGFNTYAVAILNEAPDFVLESVAGADQALWARAVHDYRVRNQVAIPGALISLTELMRDGKWIRRGIHGRTRAPFFAHMDNPRMVRFVEAFRARHDRYPSDWAVLGYDAVHALRQGIEKAGSIESPVVKDAMKGMTVDVTRGRHYFREIDNQLSVSAYFGRVADDPLYPFPIYGPYEELKGPDIWRPEREIRAARGE